MWKRWGIPVAAAVFAALVSLYFYRELPDPMAIHFGVNNEPDNFASKVVGAFSLPVILIAIPLLTRFSLRFEKDEQKIKRHLEMSSTVHAALAIALVGVHLFIIAFNLGYDIKASFFSPLIAGALFIIVGNVLPRAPQGPLRIFRMKDEQYARYARFSGRVMVAAGFVFMVSVLMPETAGTYVILAMLIVVLVSSVASAVYFNRQS